MAKSNKKKAPISEDGKSARGAIVEDSASAIPLPNLGQAVMVQAAPSRATSNQQVIILLCNIKLFDRTKRYKKRLNDSFRILLNRYKFFIMDKKGQIQPNRIMHMIMAIEVWTNPKMEYTLINNTITYKLIKIFLCRIYVKCYDEIKQTLFSISKTGENLRQKQKVYTKINNYYIQESDDDEQRRIREEAKRLEEEELLEQTDDDYESVGSNELDNTIYIPDAQDTVAGGSSVPPPVFNISTMRRNIVRPASRSRMTINDEIEADGSNSVAADRGGAASELQNNTQNSSASVETDRGGAASELQNNTQEETDGKKGGKNKPNSKNGKNPVKRGNNDETEGNKAIPKKKPFKKSYAEVAKEGARMCEIRREGGNMLQQDYDFAIIKLMYALMAFQKNKKEKDKNAWRIMGSGLSRNAVWLGVDSQECVDFLRQHVPEIREEENGPKLYEFYGPGERPFRSLRWRVPYMWCKISIQDLQEMVRMCNPELWTEIERSNGTRTEPIWKIKMRVYDSRDAVPEDGSGFVSFIIEVEEDMMRILVEECLGVLRIGATEGRLTGSGMVSEVRAYLGMNEEEEGNDEDNKEGDGRDDGEKKNDGQDKKDDTDKMDDNDDDKNE